MANYQYTTDLLSDMLRRADEPTDSTGEYYTIAQTLLNRAYLGVMSGGAELADGSFELWYWLKPSTRGTITLQPVINTGTVLVTNNSASITFSSAPTPSVAGRYFKIDGHPDTFKISAHTAGATAATLDSVFTGTTTAAATYNVYDLEYSLATDLMWLSQTMRVYQQSRVEIKGVSEAELDAMFPLNTIGPGVPTHFAAIAEQTVRFSHFGGSTSTDLIRVDYQYAAQPTLFAFTASEQPAVPHRHRKILADWACAMLLEEKGDTRATGMLALAKSGFKTMARENRWRKQQMNGGYGAIVTRPMSRPLGNRPLRTESGYILS